MAISLGSLMPAVCFTMPPVNQISNRKTTNRNIYTAGTLKQVKGWESDVRPDSTNREGGG